MAMVIRFEIQTLKDGHWQLTAVHDDKDDALSEARKLYENNKHVGGVKVYEEKHDSTEDLNKSRLIYNKVRGSEKSRVKKKTEKQEVVVEPKLKLQPPKTKNKSFTKYILLMMLLVASVVLAILGLALYFEYLSQ